MKFKFAVDCPNPHNPEDAMVCMDYFETKEEAIQYAREVFGADENGNICLVSEIPDYEEE